MDGLREWWRPGASERMPADDSGERSEAPGPEAAGVRKADGPAWQLRELASRAAAEASLDDADVSEEDLLEFLAGDIDPIEADPAFKRRLREQLWSLIRENELTRQ